MLNTEGYNNGSNKLWRRALKWLYPGMRVKRWILLMALGALLAAVGVLVLVGPYNLIIFGRKVNQVLRQWQQPGHAPPSRYTSVVLVFVGILAACLGFRQVINSLVVDLLPSDPRDLAEIIFHKRGLDNEPTLVVVGEVPTGYPLARPKTPNREDHCHCYRCRRWRKLRQDPLRARHTSSRRYSQYSGGYG